MSLCDRCTAEGCCLDYLGTACKRYRARECPDVQRTNAERIRDMSDEELAEVLGVVLHSQHGKCYNCDGEDCRACWLNWLQQPAPEEGSKIMYEKLIQRLRNAAGSPEGLKMAQDAAGAISALQLESAEKDKEIERLSEQAEAAERLQRALLGEKSTCSTYKSILARTEAERDAVRKYLFLVEFYLAHGSVEDIRRTIKTWRNGAQGEG